MKAFARGVSLICHLEFGSLLFVLRSLFFVLGPLVLGLWSLVLCAWFEVTAQNKEQRTKHKAQKPKPKAQSPKSNSLHRLISLRLLRGFLRFQLSELLLGLDFAGLVAQRCQSRVE